MKVMNPTDTAYVADFWNAMRGHEFTALDRYNAKSPRCGAYLLPASQAGKYQEDLKKENFFRRLATVIPTSEHDTHITTIVTEAEPGWIPEEGNIPEVAELLGVYDFTSHKLAALTKLHLSLLTDTGFNFENWILKSFARIFGKAEAKAFLTGNGNGQPLGVLADHGGAEIGVTTAKVDTITFDEVMSLFRSLEPKFREKAVWVMNDETALALHTLKDDSGNYLWNPASEKLLGKTVIICNEMPGIQSGSKPIAFGDFSYYWILERVPLAIRVLREKFIIKQHCGYIGVEHLDAKLIRPEAIQVMQMASSAE